MAPEEDGDNLFGIVRRQLAAAELQLGSNLCRLAQNGHNSDVLKIHPTDFQQVCVELSIVFLDQNHIGFNFPSTTCILFQVTIR